MHKRFVSTAYNLFSEALLSQCIHLAPHYIWAWAVLDYWPSAELVELYRRRLARNIDEFESRIDAVQLFQAHLAFEHFSPHGAVLQGELLEKSRQTWEETSSGRITVSGMHRDVSEVLTRWGGAS